MTAQLTTPDVDPVTAAIRVSVPDRGLRQDLRAVLAMAAAGKIRSQVTTRPLTQVNEAMADLRNGTVSGRIVLTPR